MVRLEVKINGRVTPYISYRIKESFNYLVSEVAISFYEDIHDNPIDINGIRFIKISNQLLSNGTVMSTFWPKSFMDLINSELQPVNKVMNFESLADLYGIKTAIRHKTTPVYWCLPRIKFWKLIEEAKNKIVVSNGGGVVLHYGMNDKLRVTDLKKSCEANDVINILGTLRSSSRDRSWIGKVPADYQVIKNSIESSEEITQLKFTDGLGIGAISPIIFNELSKDSPEQEVTNIFYRKLYTSTIWRYENVQVHEEIHLGATIVDAASKKKSVVYEIEIEGNQESHSLKLMSVSKA